MDFSTATREDRNKIVELFRRAGSNQPEVAREATAEIIQAVEIPLRETLLTGDIISDIFDVEIYNDTRPPMYPLDLLTPSQESEYYAYAIPSEGALPRRMVEGDYVMVPTYEIGNSIDCRRQLLRDVNFSVVQRMMNILEAGFVKKTNDDGWQTILAAAVDRNIVINDGDASAGQFTPKIVTLMKTFMRRNGGGNAATLGRSRLTDLYVSPEAQDDIRSWTLSEVPDEVRTNIYYATDNGSDLIRVYGVNIHAYDEFGEGQEYQNYFANQLGGSMAASDTEIIVGLDLQNPSDSFVSPVREELKIYEDNTTHRDRIFSLYGHREHGFAVLDSRRVILGSI